jgi:integrase/recombinase XerD
VAALTFAHVQQRDGRWRIVDLIGKHGRVRTAPMPAWVRWQSMRGPRQRTSRLITYSGPWAERGRYRRTPGRKRSLQMLRQYAAEVGVPGIAPHDLRRTCAKLCRAAGGELEQIQMLPCHASVQTTERYLATKQNLVHAPNDAILLRVAV